MMMMPYPSFFSFFYFPPCPAPLHPSFQTCCDGRLCDPRWCCCSLTLSLTHPPPIHTYTLTLPLPTLSSLITIAPPLSSPSTSPSSPTPSYPYLSLPPPPPHAIKERTSNPPSPPVERFFPSLPSLSNHRHTRHSFFFFTLPSAHFVPLSTTFFSLLSAILPLSSVVLPERNYPLSSQSEASGPNHTTLCWFPREA